MQNRANMCIALYSLQNAFTYTSSFIPSSFLSIYQEILYIPGTMLETKGTKNEQNIQGLYS